MIKVNVITNGYLEENCYIVENNNECLIVDPGSESNRIIEEIEKLKLKVKGILITHYHFDHIGALDEIKSKYKNALVFDYNSSDNIKIGSFEFKTVPKMIDQAKEYLKQNGVKMSDDFKKKYGIE